METARFNNNQIKAFAVEIDRREIAKRDFIVRSDSEQFSMGGNSELRIGQDSFGVNEHAHGQIAARLQIPKVYYDRMRRESPALLRDNVNHWLRSAPESLMVRTLGGEARAVLSKRYRPLDNFDLMEAIFPAIAERQLKVEEAALTDMRLYLRLIFPTVEREIRKGDVVKAGVVISNSEVGAGALKVEGMIWRLVCSNGLITGAAIRRTHIGGKLGIDGDDISEYLRDETRLADDRATMMKIRDVVEANLNPEFFEAETNKLLVAAGDVIRGSLPAVVEKVSARVGLQNGERDGVLRYLAEGGDLSRWGMINAITRTAQDVESFDRQIDIERAAMQIVELPRNDWENLNRE